MSIFLFIPHISIYFWLNIYFINFSFIWVVWRNVFSKLMAIFKPLLWFCLFLLLFWNHNWNGQNAIKIKTMETVPGTGTFLWPFSKSFVFIIWGIQFSNISFHVVSPMNLWISMHEFWFSFMCGKTIEMCIFLPRYYCYYFLLIYIPQNSLTFT